MIELLLGINRESWEQALESSRTGIRTAGYMFVAFALLMLLGGIELIHGLTGSWWAGLFGGPLAGLMMANIVRLALITVTVRIPDVAESDPTDEAVPDVVPPAGDTVSTAVRTTKTLGQRLRHGLRKFSRLFQVAGLLRILFMALVAGAMSFPVAALFMRDTAGEILDQRRDLVIREFVARHPDYPPQRLEAYRSRIGREYFPIHVYMELYSTAGWTLWFTVTMGLAFLPYVMLHRQHVQCSGGYFDLNGKRMRRQIVVQYLAAMESAETDIRRRFTFALPVPQTPHLEWENPPFNTVLKKPSEEGWRTGHEWNEFLKGS